MSTFAHPEVLVSTDWVKKHLDDPKVKLVEIDVDTKAYDAGHIPGAVGFNWESQLQDQVRRDILSKDEFQELLGASGISPDDTVILYGDNNNWFAAYGLWLFKLYGHDDVRLMDGGRVKWLAEESNPLTTDAVTPTRTSYEAKEPNPDLRAFYADVRQASSSGSFNLVDVRSPDEFSGKVIAPPGMNETAQRGGHIPGALSIPWATAVGEHGAFKPVDELRKIYLDEKRVDTSKPTIAYCRIGERSSHTWFVLRYLLGIENVRNYDGSWTEYGNIIGAPIEK